MSNEKEDYNIKQEPRNIKSVITLTRNNIDVLNAKFADYPNPPPMYVKEYEELTRNLYDLESQKEFEGSMKLYPQQVQFDMQTRTRFMRPRSVED